MTTHLSRLEQTIAQGAAARHAALLSDLRRYVEIPTGPGSTSGLDETRGLIADRLARLGAKLELVPGEPKPAWLEKNPQPANPPPTLFAKRHTPVTPNRARVLLSGHLDTVHDPASAFRTLTIAADEKTATGPGVVDMKGGLVIALHALEVLEECGQRVSWSFVLNSDEETGSYHSDTALRTIARDCDVGLALEPAMTNGGLVIERAGSGQFMIECTGKAAHVGRDFTAGVSAVNALAACITRVAELPRPEQGLVANIGPLEGGIAPNVVADRARAWGNIRYPSIEAGRELESALKSMQTTGNALPGISVLTSLNRPAKPLTPQVQQLANLARAAAEDLGQSLPFGKTAGVCDGNNLQAAGLPTIDTLGVRGGGLHTPTEWIELSSLVERCQLLAVLISRLASGAWKAD